MMTREQYLQQYTTGPQGERTHREYYAQFVNADTIAHVVRRLGATVLLESCDPHFNDIPLARWDSLARGLPLACSFGSRGDYPTLSGLVCVAKEAARQFCERRRAAGGTTP